jgi:hypothetical protein
MAELNFSLSDKQKEAGEKLLKDILKPISNPGDMDKKEYEDFVKSLIGKDDSGTIMPTNFPSKETVMPVDRKVTAILNLGLKDLDMKDEVVPVTVESIGVTNLRPTQSQIGILDSLGFLAFQLGPEKQKTVVKSYLDGNPDLGGGKIITANGKFIIDGHHRWSGVYLLQPNASIDCFNLTIDTNDEEKLLAIMQLAVASTYGGLFMKPADTASDIYNYEGSLEDLIKKVLLGDYGYNNNKKPAGQLANCLTFIDCLAGQDPNIEEHDLALTKSEDEVKELIKKKIEDNPEVINMLITNAEGIKAKGKKDAPARIAMPQPKDTAEKTGSGGGDLPDDVRKKLISGELNFKDPISQNFAYEKKWVKTFEQFRNKK